MMTHSSYIFVIEITLLLDMSHGTETGAFFYHIV